MSEILKKIKKSDLIMSILMHRYLELFGISQSLMIAYLLIVILTAQMPKNLFLKIVYLKT